MGIGILQNVGLRLRLQGVAVMQGGMWVAGCWQDVHFKGRSGRNDFGSVVDGE